MNDDNARATKPKHKSNTSSRRRRPATPQSPRSTQSNRHFLLSVASTGGSLSQDDSNRRLSINSYNSHVHGHVYRPGHLKKRSSPWFQRMFSFSKWRTLSRSHSHVQQHSQVINGIQKSKKHGKDTTAIALFCLFSMFTIYVVAFIYFVPLVNNSSNQLPSAPNDINIAKNQPVSQFPPTIRKNFKSHPPSDFDYNDNDQHSELIQQLKNMQVNADEIAKTKSQQRRQRTRPPPYSPQSKKSPKEEENIFGGKNYVHRAIHTLHLDTASIPSNSDTELAQSEDICGVIAKSTLAESQQNNNPFDKKHVLNKNSVVLITGILNPLGFHLALELQNQCGVTRIIGMDSILPNTLLHRLDMMRKLAILTIRIPNLYQPVYVSYVGISPKNKKAMQDEVDVVKKFNPTHIIHLGAMEGSYRDSEGYSTLENNSPLMELRQASISMEQILTSVRNNEPSKRPHVTYVSSVNLGENSGFSGVSKLSEELIANTYRKLYGVHSVGVRMGNLYGPWCAKRGTKFYELIDQIVRQLDHEMPEDDEKEWTYVQNAVDLIITAMQYRSNEDGSTTLTTDGYKDSFRGLISKAKDILHGDIKSENTIQQRSQGSNTLQSPVTIGVEDGLIQTLAWHLDLTLPYGSTHSVQNSRSQNGDHVIETGNEFLNRLELPSCAPDDDICRFGMPTFPCASECVNQESTCNSSIFSDVLQVSKKVTNGCDIILYTSFLDLENDEQITLESEVQSGQPQMNEKICNIGFISRNHQRVQELKGKNLTKQNGKIKELGWNLIWVDDEKGQISHADRYLPKLSPGKLFSSSVKFALFVEESFKVAPSIEYILFITNSMHRKALPERTAKLRSPEGKRIKVHLPPDQARRAILLATPIKNPKGSTQHETLSITQATKMFKSEKGLDPDSPDSKSLMKQREFYNRIPSYIDREDFRPLSEPKFKLQMKNWIHSRWIIHDLSLEEARQFRCEWYDEHILWGNELDQLSFAYVMAKKELEKNIGHIEFEVDEEESSTEEWEDAILDNNDWFPILDVNDGLTPFFETIDIDDSTEEEDIPNIQLAKDENNVELFVRIVSDNIMAIMQEEWLNARKKTKGRA